MNCLFFTLFLLPIILADETDECNNRNMERREHSIEEIPYIIGLKMENHHRPEKYGYFAAGIVIDRNMVLTLAYHCEVSMASEIRMFAGEAYILNGRNKIFAQDYMLHPQRSGPMGRKTLDELGGNLGNYTVDRSMDYCLLRLRSDIQFSQSAQKAPLPFPDDPLPGNPGSTRYLTSGWGNFLCSNCMIGNCGRSGKSYSDWNKVGLFMNLGLLIDDASCKEVMKEVGLPEGNFCLGGFCENHHNMYGDDGGPVVDVQSQTVVGMVVNVREFDTKEKPQQMIRLAPAVQWINEMRAKWAPEDPADIPTGIPSEQTESPTEATTTINP